MQCEMCGKEEKLVVAIIEDVKMNVCSECAKFSSRTLREPVEPALEAPKRKKRIKETKEEIVEMIIPDFSKKIRKAREKLGLDQEKFGEKVGLKESIIHKMETGDYTPSIDIARKLERLLQIKLVIEYKEEKKKYEPGETAGFTILLL